MATKLTLAQAQQQRRNLTAKRLMRLLGKNETQMFWFCHNAGMIFLKKQCNGDAWGIDMLKGEAFYWKWWRNQWVIRDEQFIAQYRLWNPEWNNLSAKEQSRLIQAYEALHRSSFTNQAMAIGYEQILSKVVDREVKSQKPLPKKHTYEHFLITK